MHFISLQSSSLAAAVNGSLKTSVIARHGALSVTQDYFIRELTRSTKKSLSPDSFHKVTLFNHVSSFQRRNYTKRKRSAPCIDLLPDGGEGTAVAERRDFSTS